MFPHLSAGLADGEVRVVSGIEQHSGLLGDRIAAGRSRHLVGRLVERELFRTVLELPDPSPVVLFVHGPPGIGKSTLLSWFASIAHAHLFPVVSIDGREVAGSHDAVLESLPEEVVSGGSDDRGQDRDRVVVFVDNYDELAPMDDWIRKSLLPRFPSSVVTVLAARHGPEPGWRIDASWQDLLRVVSLRNLDPAACREYLEARNVPARHHGRLVQLSHGHPLGLSLLVDVQRRQGNIRIDPLAPDVVAILLRQFVDVVPDPDQRRALEACGIARTTTESILRDGLGLDDAHALFHWLAGLSFVESAHDGLMPHALARDVLEAELRWRDPETHRLVFRQVRDHVQHRLHTTRGRERRRAILDLKFMFKTVAGEPSPVDWRMWGQHLVAPARKQDREFVLGLVADAEGDASAVIAERWWERQREAFLVVREHGHDRGLLVLLDLTAADAADRAADPGAAAAWKHALATAPPRPGELVTQTRYVIDRECYQDPSPTMNAVPVVTLERYLDLPALARDYLAVTQPDRWNDYFDAADLPRAVGGDFVVGGQHFGQFCHDFRRVPTDDLVRLWTERALARDPAPAPHAAMPQLLVLSHPEFRDAVKQALGDLRDPARLARNPLLRTRLVRRCADASEHPAGDVDDLEGLLADAIDSLREDPRDDKLLRAVTRTYVHGAPTQRAAAEVLDLPFSTYRRHLSRAVDRIVAWLWDRELGQPIEPG